MIVRTVGSVAEWAHRARALILAAACRAFSWRLVVNELDPPLLDEWADTVAYSVRSVLELAEAAP